MTAEPSGGAGSAVAALIRAANIELIPLRGAEEKLAAIPAEHQDHHHLLAEVRTAENA